MKYQYEDQLGEAPILPLVMRMTIPSVIAQVVNLLYNIVDRIYIGHIEKIGTDALAGVGICSTLIILITAFSQFTGGGGVPLAAIYLGRGDRAKAEKMLGNGLTLNLILSACMFFAMNIFMRPLLFTIGASDSTIGYAVSYFRIYLTGTAFVMITVSLNGFINAQGRAGIAMLSTLIGAALNIILDPIFIYKFEMGVSGAALATVISQAVSAGWIIRFLTSSKASLRLKAPNMKPKAEILKHMCALGISPVIMGSTESMVGFVLNGSLSAYGDIYVSALTILQGSLQFVNVPLTGFAQGFSPIISYNYGHRNNQRVRDIFKMILTVQTLYGFILVSIMVLFPSVFARIFTSDPELIATVKKTMPVFVAGMSIFGLQRSCQNTFIALDEARISIFIALIRKIILLIPLAFILPMFMGVMGVYTAEAFSDASAAICCIIIFAFKFPRILKSNE